MTEETLVQKVTADYLLNQLQWYESVLGMYETLAGRRVAVAESVKILSLHWAANIPKVPT